MGKYTLSVLSALVKNLDRSSKISPKLLLNKNLNVSKERVDFIKNTVGCRDVLILDLPADISSNYADKYRDAESVLTDFVKSHYDDKEVSYLIMAPFFVDFPAVFPNLDSVKKYSIVYDIIPHKIWKFQRIFPDDIYFRHFQVLAQADTLFSISQSVKDDLVELLGFDADSIININGGPFKSIPSHKAKTAKLKKPYILMPSAPIIHKNNERSVAAFSEFNEMHECRYTLYITSSFDENQQKLLKTIDRTNSVEFTGNISDQDLASAYRSASAVLFSSLTEGLGMPVIEGVTYGVPIACSNIPVLREISEEAFYQFNPLEVAEISKALSEATNRLGWTSKKAKYQDVLSKYTWENSAQQIIKGLSKKVRRYKNNKHVFVYAPSPAKETPAGNFAEILYAQIFKESESTTIVYKKLNKKPRRPHYTQYIQQNSSSDSSESIKISIKDKYGLLKIRKRVTMVVEGLGSKKILNLSAKNTIYDAALGIERWEFFDAYGRVLSPQKLLKKTLR